MLSLYAMGLLIGGGVTGLLIAVACSPQRIKEKFNSLLWNPEEDEL